MWYTVRGGVLVVAYETQTRGAVVILKTMSATRKRYFVRLVCRVLIFIVFLLLCFAAPQVFDVMEGNDFFRILSPLHILWLIWIADMVLQIVPIKSNIALGSQKLFANRFHPILEKINYQALKNYIISTTKSAYLVMLIWTFLIAVIGVLYYTHVIDRIWLFMISVCFYVCDLICVLIWCPFRLIMKNKCCTTCRIFNWDHLMMFSPLIFVGGFYAISLVAMAFLAWLVWELCVMIYPERFWEITNQSLKCGRCKDKLCTQYCQKLRK